MNDNGNDAAAVPSNLVAATVRGIRSAGAIMPALSRPACPSLSRFLCKGPVGVHRWGSIRSG